VPGVPLSIRYRLSPASDTLLPMNTFWALLTGGGLAALGALLSGVLTNLLGAKRDERRYGHEQAMAQEARRQERLAQTYIELLAYLSHYSDWAESIRPLKGPALNHVPREERWNIEALVSGYGSEDVNGLLRKWGEYANKLEDVAAALRRAEQSQNRSPKTEDWLQGQDQAIRMYKGLMAEIDEAIRNRVSQELAGEA
jgi:hypothetical protein